MDSVRRYLAARSAWLETDDELSKLQSQIRRIDHAIHEAPEHAWIAGVADSPEPLKADERDDWIKPDEYPSFDHLARTLNAWHRARREIIAGYSDLPAELREDMSAPPGISEWELKRLRTPFE